MAHAPLRRCTKPGCRKLQRTGRCEEHQREWLRTSTKHQPGDPFYSSTAWRRTRQAKLQEQPLCEECSKRGKVTAANEVHHVKPRVQYPELAFDWDNLACLCKACHSRETAKERRNANSTND